MDELGAETSVFPEWCLMSRHSSLAPGSTDPFFNDYISGASIFAHTVDSWNECLLPPSSTPAHDNSDSPSSVSTWLNLNTDECASFYPEDDGTHNHISSPTLSSSTAASPTAGEGRRRGRRASADKQAPKTIEKRYRCKLQHYLAELTELVPTLREKPPIDGTASDGLIWTHKRNKATVFAKTVEYIKYLEQRPLDPAVVARLQHLEGENAQFRALFRDIAPVCLSLGLDEH